MKIIIQLFLIFILIIIGVLFYNNYFSSKKIQNLLIQNNSDSKNNLLFDGENKDEKIYNNNAIKNLRYQVEMADSGKYQINAKLSELIYINEIETVSMKSVNALIIDKDNEKIIITSDKAIFNSSSYMTEFNDNIKIIFLKNIITSEKLEFNFNENVITISENIMYKGLNTTIKADNIKIDLITKNIEVFMDNPNNKIELKSEK